MKTVSKKLLSLLLAAMLVLSLGVMASAASSSVYSMHVANGKVQFVQNGAAVGSFNLKSADFSLKTDADKDFVVCFVDANGNGKAVNLSKQTSLSISGSMNSLTIDKSLDSAISVTMNGTATKMTVNAPNKVNVNGSVTTLAVNAAANVVVGDKASIKTVNVSNSKATVKNSAGQSVKTNTVSSPSTSTNKNTINTSSNKGNTINIKNSNTSTSSDSRIRLTTKAINADYDDTLDDLIDELNDNVEAYDTVNKEYLSGDCDWKSSRTSYSLDKSGTHSFVFTPDDRNLPTVTGNIKIYVYGNSEDVTLSYNSTMYFEDGDRLSDYTRELKDSITARNDEGDEIRGSVSWSNGSKTEIRSGRSYTFKFKPSSSRYETVEGSVKFVLND